MIAKSNKFPLRTEFIRFRKHAKQLVSPHLRIYLSSHVPSRLAIIIPVKVSKKATTRNALRRFVYDHVWEQIEPLQLDCVVLFKPIALLKGGATIKLIEGQVDSLLKNNLK